MAQWRRCQLNKRSRVLFLAQGGILNFVTSHFKNCIKAILHVSAKLKQFHWKALNIAQLNQYTRNDIQCSLSAIRRRANSCTCGNFVNLRLFNKLQNMGRHTGLGGGLRNVTTYDKDGRGIRKSWNSCDVIYGWPLSINTRHYWRVCIALNLRVS